MRTSPPVDTSCTLPWTCRPCPFYTNSDQSHLVSNCRTWLTYTLARQRIQLRTWLVQALRGRFPVLSALSYLVISLVCQSIQQVAFASGVPHSSWFPDFLSWFYNIFSFSFIVNLDLLLTFFMLHYFRISLIEITVFSAFQQLYLSLPVTAQSSSCSVVLYFSFQLVLQVVVTLSSFTCREQCDCSATSPKGFF